MADSILLKNKHIRKLAGVKFRILSPEIEEIGRPDHDFKPYLRDASGMELIVRKVNIMEPWYADGNVEMKTGKDTWEVVPGFGNADADGHGEWVTPMIDEKTHEIIRTESGRAKTRCKFKWYAAFDIVTETNVTVQLPRPQKDAQGNKVMQADGKTPVFEDVPFTGCQFRVEFGSGGSMSQYRKLLAAIDTFLQNARNLGVATTADETGVWVTMHYNAASKEPTGFYTFEAVGLYDQKPVTAPTQEQGIAPEPVGGFDDLVF